MTIQDFRAWLKRRLHDRAAEIQRGFADRLPTSKELDAIGSLLDLAADTNNLSGHVFLLFKKLLLIKDLKSSFDQVSNDYFRTIDSEVPRDATDLLRRLIMSSLRHRSSALSPSHR